jgi:uncharacterized membrane protein YoaK (UPF0700 family)
MNAKVAFATVSFSVWVQMAKFPKVELAPVAAVIVQPVCFVMDRNVCAHVKPENGATDRQLVMNAKVAFATVSFSVWVQMAKFPKVELAPVAAVIVQPVCFVMDQNV